MLNPIGNVWDKVKSRVKAQMTVPLVTPPNLGEQRLQYVESFIDSAMSQVANEDSSNSAQHATSFYPAAIAADDMMVGT